MKKFLSLFFSFLMFLVMFPARAEDITYVFSADIWKMAIGEEIPGGEYYLIPTFDYFTAASTDISYIIIHDYASKVSESDPRDTTKYQCLSYPLHADHIITLENGDQLLMFSDPACDILLVPKGQDATGGLSGLSYETLIARKNQINLAIWRSKEWQEVTVPQGTWEVGEDIPAGHWSVKCADGAWSATINWGESIQENSEDISRYGRYSMNNTIYNPSNSTFDPINDVSIYSFEVQEGDYIKIERGSVVFMPYIGKPEFGFK